MRVAIAGGTGFLGGAVSRALVARGDIVVALPRRGPPHTALFDAATRSHAPERHLPVGSHLAERSHGPLVDGRPDECDALIWAAGTRDVELDLGRAAHVDDLVVAVDQLRPRRVIYLSTGEVYGDGTVPFRETALLAGSSAYALAKLDGEAALRGIASSRELVATALRIGVAYGAGQRPAMLIPQLVRALRAGEPIALSAGHQTRDFVHVDDVVDAVLGALAAPSLPPAINIGTGIETRVCDLCCELARRVARAIGRPVPELLDLLRFGERAQRAGEPARYALSIELAARVLHWQPQLALADGLPTVIHPSIGSGML